MKNILTISSLLLIVSAINANATEVVTGESLHAQHCEACHAGMTGGNGSLIYTRDNRRVKDFNGLQTQVRQCERRLGLKWFDEDIDKVVAYLNKNYYKFPVQ